jgi:hypothetical protein
MAQPFSLTISRGMVYAIPCLRDLGLWDTVVVRQEGAGQSSSVDGATPAMREGDGDGGRGLSDSGSALWIVVHLPLRLWVAQAGIVDSSDQKHTGPNTTSQDQRSKEYPDECSESGPSSCLQWGVTEDLHSWGWILS